MGDVESMRRECSIRGEVGRSPSAHVAVMGIYGSSIPSLVFRSVAGSSVL
jgi:hypothetical protein